LFGGGNHDRLDSYRRVYGIFARVLDSEQDQDENMVARPEAAINHAGE
jgi:hypothetical protein